MNREKILAGLDLGHAFTKAVVIRNQEILGYTLTPTGLNVAASAQAALNQALKNAGIHQSELSGIAATGKFKDVIREVQQYNAIKIVPEYVAIARGALFLNKNSRTVIDIGANTCKVISCDQNGTILDAVYNDKCADGLGIFYATTAKILGLDEDEMSEFALKSTNEAAIATQCTISAESDLVSLIFEGVDVADLANAALRFIAERVSAMCTYMPLREDIVVTGGLATSKALIKHLSSLIRKNISAINLPQYAGAIGAAMNYEG